MDVCNFTQVIKQEPLNQLCDVYSFGMVLLEILTGKVPFHEEDSDLLVPGLVVNGKVRKREKREQNCAILVIDCSEAFSCKLA